MSSSANLRLLALALICLAPPDVTRGSPTYPSGVLSNMNNSTKIKPLSELYIFRDNSSRTFHPYPIPPDCSRILDIREQQHPATITIWSVDQQSKSEWGLLIWKESVKTYCTWEFWGTYKNSEGERSSIAINDPPTLDDLETYWSLPENQVVEFYKLSYSEKYSCYWCHNEHPGTYEMIYIKKVRIIHYPDGSIKHPDGDWRAITNSLLKDGYRILHSKMTGEIVQCPFKIHDIKASVISQSKSGNILISVPVSNLQFSVNPKSESISCVYSNIRYEIIQSLGGYLLSIDTGSTYWKKLFPIPSSGRVKRYLPFFPDTVTARYYHFTHAKTSPHIRNKREPNIWEFSRGLKTSLDYAQLRYEQNYVINQINKNFGLLQKSICENQYKLWLSLSPPDLTSKIAHYFTGNIYSIGEVHFSGYSVQHTEKTFDQIILADPLVVQKGMFKAIRLDSKIVTWVEPVTGILYSHPVATHYSRSANWLPGLNGTAIIPATGKILFPEITIDHLNIIEQAEAKNIRSLYTDSELYGSNSEFATYRNSAYEESNTLDFWSKVPEFIIHIVISILMGFVVALLVPSCTKLLKKIISKGEEQLEIGLNLRKSYREQETRPVWG